LFTLVFKRKKERKKERGREGGNEREKKE